MQKIMVVFGTRPEAIKLCPLIQELNKRKNMQTFVCITGQHRELLQEVLTAFSIRANHNLAIMEHGQTLFDITHRVLCGMRDILQAEKPDFVVVHGDTTTSFAAALACFYLQIPVAHVEAGLRTYQSANPFPEEFNRRAIAPLANLHFAPTQSAANNLLAEGVSQARIFVTGNTAIDALATTVSADFTHPILDWVGTAPFLLLTAHRRESIGAQMRSIFKGICKVLQENPAYKAVFPMHPNPKVQAIAQDVFKDCNRILLCPALGVVSFHNLLARCTLVLTDSGGIQEEAPALGKPVLVLRKNTERTEGICAGTLRLVGTDANVIAAKTAHLLQNREAYLSMANAKNPYGDGLAAKRIADILKSQ